MTTHTISSEIGLCLNDDFKQPEAQSEVELFATKIGLLGKLFGCGHGDLSRPFSHGKIGYRSCLKCGAIKRFNPETLQTLGGFYYPPAIVRRETV